MNTDLGYPPALFKERKPRGVEIFIVELQGPSMTLVPAMTTVAKQRADALVFNSWPRIPVQSPYRGSHCKGSVCRLSMSSVEFVELGGLLSFERDIARTSRRIAMFVDKILRGARPADLPVEEPTAFDLAINLKTARPSGITIPRDLLVRADWIVE